MLSVKSYIKAVGHQVFPQHTSVRPGYGGILDRLAFQTSLGPNLSVCLDDCLPRAVGSGPLELEAVCTTYIRAENLTSVLLENIVCF